MHYSLFVVQHTIIKAIILYREAISKYVFMIKTSIVIPGVDREIQVFQGFLDTRLRPAGMTVTTSLILRQVLITCNL